MRLWRARRGFDSLLPPFGTVSVSKLLIARGNSTALVYNSPSRKRKKLAKSLLDEVEQVGFIKNRRLTMMGGELCINATLAFASTLKKKGRLYASGIKNSVEYENKGNKTIIKIPLKYKRLGDIILLNGIGFKITNEKADKRLLKRLSEKYNMPAFGIINYNRNKITPYVYVRRVNSFVKETACGSGSIAYSIFSGYKRVIQPTGKVISIKIGKTTEVSAKVSKLSLQELK